MFVVHLVRILMRRGGPNRPMWFCSKIEVRSDNRLNGRNGLNGPNLPEDP